MNKILVLSIAFCAFLIGKVGDCADRWELLKERSAELKKCFELKVTDCGIDADGHSFIKMKLTYSRDNASASRMKLPEAMGIHAAYLPWEAAGTRLVKITVKNRDGEIREIPMWVLAIDYSFSVEGAAILNDRQSIEGELYLDPDKPENSDPKPNAVADSIEMKIQARIPCFIPEKKTKSAHPSKIPYGFADLESEWVKTPARWEPKVGVLAMPRK
jgi:hypothetical protein